MGGQGARFLGVKGRKYKLWWSGNNEGIGGFGILVKDEICERAVGVRRSGNRVMMVVMVFGEEVVRVISVYIPQRGRQESEKHQFYDKLACEWDLQNGKEFVLV